MRTFVCIAMAIVALSAICEAVPVDEEGGAVQLLDVDVGVDAAPLEEGSVRKARAFFGGFGPRFGGFGRGGFGGFGGYGRGFGFPRFGGFYG